MHSAAINALVSVQQAADSIGASLRVVNPSPSAARLLGTTGAATTLERQPVGV